MSGTIINAGRVTGSTYKNDLLGFSITMPTDWHILGKEELEKEEINSCLFAAEEAEDRGSGKANIITDATSFPERISLTELAQEFRERVEKTDSTVALSETKKMIGGFEFVSLKSDHDVQGVRVHQETLACVKNNTALWFTYSWFDLEQKQQLDNIMSTLTWD